MMKRKHLTGSPRVEGDDDEEDVDDIEHEFNIDEEQNNNSHIAESMLHGKMSYGRGHDDDSNAQYPHDDHHGEPMLSSLHKRVHPYGSPEFGIHLT